MSEYKYMYKFKWMNNCMNNLSPCIIVDTLNKKDELREGEQQKQSCFQKLRTNFWGWKAIEIFVVQYSGLW